MRIIPIQTGEVQIKTRHLRARRSARSLRVLDVLSDRNWAPRLPIFCFAIEHSEGVIAVDTGESSRADDPGYQPRWHLFAQYSERRWVAPSEESGAQLRALGIDPGEIECLVMTHMHGDHAGGLSHFAGAEILLSEDEAAMALARSGPLNGYFNQHYPGWFDPKRLRIDGEPWEGFASTHPLTADGRVRLLPTPGHTSGHMSVVVEQADHLVLLSGDACYSEAALLSGVVDGVCQDASAHRRSTALLRELCSRRDVVVLPSHDPDGPRRLAETVFTRPDREPSHRNDPDPHQEETSR